MSEALEARLATRLARYLRLREVVKNHQLVTALGANIRVAAAFGPEQHTILLVGDRPGPGAPKDPTYHHTAFHSLKNCSGWMNRQLEAEGIPEERLLWINAADKDGNPESADLVSLSGATTIISLGGNAERWLKKIGMVQDVKSYHPQYWKRFRSKEPYPLITLLKKLTN